MDARTFMFLKAPHDASPSPVRVSDKFYLVPDEYTDTVKAHFPREIGEQKLTFGHADTE
jgi:hypothetical protein